MSRTPSPVKIARLQKLAAMQSDAARQAMSPLQQERTRVLADIRRVRETLRQSQASSPEAAMLVGQSLSAQRYAMWCQTQLASLQRKVAILEVKRIPLAKAMAHAEARRLVLNQMSENAKAAARKATSRALEDGANQP